jgi:nitrite reductase/ring-hydroxylating ferredoxin subunit
MTDTPHQQARSSEAKKPSRRDVLRIGCAATILGTVGAAGLLTQTSLYDRMLGITHTPLLDDPSVWSYTDNTLSLALAQVPDLALPGTAVRLEDEQVPENLLIVHGTDDQYYVFVNSCTHSGRKIDLDDSGQLKCTSMGQSKFTYQGEVISGSAESPLTTYTVDQSEGQLVITLA